MRRNKKKTIIFLFFIVISCIGLGYAFLTTTLSIDGITDVDANNWSIYWDNTQVKSGSVTGDQVTQAPTIDSSNTSVSFNVRLKEPGEFYEFTVDAVNDGSIDAMVDVFSKKVNNGTTIPDYLNYTVTYEDSVEIEQYNLLRANSSDTYKVRVEYRTDIDPEDLPLSNTSLTLTFSVTYVQADSNALERLYCGFHYSDGKTLSTVVAGDTVKTMTESFRITHVTNDYVIAVPLYNIELTTDNPVQNASAGTVEFAPSKYWGNSDIDMFYKADGVNYSNNVQQYIDAYQTTIENMCGVNFTARIMYSSDYYSANQPLNNPSGVGSYWMGTPYPPDYEHGFIYIVSYSSGALNFANSSSGVRPILEISKE